MEMEISPFCEKIVICCTKRWSGWGGDESFAEIMVFPFGILASEKVPIKVLAEFYGCKTKQKRLT